MSKLSCFNLVYILSAMCAMAEPAIAGDGEEQTPPPEAQLVAPGVWKIRLGDPEVFTPVHFRSAPVDEQHLTTLPQVNNLPLDMRSIAFRVTGRGCSLELPMEQSEGIYGLGLSTTMFDMTKTAAGRTGRRVFLAPSDSPENDRGESHAPAPFFVSTRGFGIFVDTARFASFYTGDVAPRWSREGDRPVAASASDLYRPREIQSKIMLVDIPAAKGVDLYVFEGPQMLDAVKRYNLFSGGGCVPPLWGLGVQYRGYGQYGAEELLGLARQLRADHIPCDVWGVEPGWQSKTYSCSFVWNQEKFPDPDGFIRQMHALGYRLNFWEHAFTHPSSPMFDALKPWSGNYLVWGGLVPDFATAEGRSIFLKQNEAALFSRGVDAVKLDECDYQPSTATPWSFPPASIFPSGLDGEQMHSLFGILYQQTMLEPYCVRNKRTWGLVRDSHAMAAPLPYVLYSDSYSHSNYVRGLVNEGFSGLLWAPEVRDTTSVEDLFRRVQTAVFSPLTLINCWEFKNPPWVQVDLAKNNRGQIMPGHEQVADGIRTILELRMSLVPYLYSAFNDYHHDGTPPIRALVMDWPNDTNVGGIDDEYMFGPSILVAPLFASQAKRAVYLPSGDWYDFWTHERIAGGQTIDATNSQEQIPLYVKAGTLLPLAAAVETIGTNTCFDITVHGFGEKNFNDFVLYEDDGVSLAFEKGDQSQIRLHWDKNGHNVKKTGRYSGPDRYRVVDWKLTE